ncbi:hypothetical protein [Acetanaerobacterium elongatum]|uniref:Putative membrane protein n=1 Tax=Acetanaerobacterium elongatum TaxID=258515 RepID=A0A1H0EF85_9FIRM|nr:hypothetical protein [Acetanaerobacterium elongatum]SDN80919.1 putative membrane protein [Acetanaerobacterium elongatum]
MSCLDKRSVFKTIASITAVAAIVGCMPGVVYASPNTAQSLAPGETSSLESDIKDMVKINKTAKAYDKEETVYVISDPNGKVQEVDVSDWLKNSKGEDVLEDYTELSDIQNTKGDEPFTALGDNRYEWKAGGKDIHYEGKLQKELPVTVSVAYSLNGQTVSPDALANKSGHVIIRFDYANHQKVEKKINGKMEAVSVPFLMVSGVVLDNNTFSNVKVTSGTVFNDGSRNIVLGYAVPGLEEELGLTNKDIDIPDYVEIEADTTNFSLVSTMTVAMTGLFDNVDINENSGAENLTDSLKQLNSAATRLMDGSSDLWDGMSTLYTGCANLNEGAGKLASGAKDMLDGSAALSSGAGELCSGLGTLSGKNQELNDGAKKITDAVFASATTQLRQELVASGVMTEGEAAKISLTPSTYASVFQQLSHAVTVTPEQVEAQIRASLSAMTREQQNLAMTIAYDLIQADPALGYTDAITRAAGMMSDAAAVQADCAVINAAWLADPDNQALIAQIMAATHSDQPTAAKLCAVAKALDANAPLTKLSDAATMLQHASTVASTTADNSKLTALCTAIANASAATGNSKLDAVKAQLDGVVKFYNGVLAYTEGVATAYDGSKKLSLGASALNDGAKALYNGAYTLYEGSQKLMSGAGTLKDGCNTMKNGMKKFYDEGISKLTNGLSGDYKELVERLCAVESAGREYQSFAGISDGMSGRVKFIYRTDSIGM